MPLIGGRDELLVGHTVVVEVDQEPPLVADAAVDGQLVEAVGHVAAPPSTEVAGEDVIAREAERVRQVAVGEVDVFGIEVEVAVGIDVHGAGGPDADLGSGVDREAGDEIAAGHAVAAGEDRILRRIAGRSIRRRADCWPGRRDCRRR